MSTDLIARLRGPTPSIPAMRDAADEIERLHAQIDRMRRDHNAEIREIERDARHAVIDAAAEERWKAAQGDEYGSY